MVEWITNMALDGVDRNYSSGDFYGSLTRRAHVAEMTAQLGADVDQFLGDCVVLSCGLSCGVASEGGKWSKQITEVAIIPGIDNYRGSNSDAWSIITALLLDKHEDGDREYDFSDISVASAFGKDSGVGFKTPDLLPTAEMSAALRRAEEKIAVGRERECPSDSDAVDY